MTSVFDGFLGPGLDYILALDLKKKINLSTNSLSERNIKNLNLSDISDLFVAYYQCEGKKIYFSGHFHGTM